MKSKGRILILANECYPQICVGGLGKFVAGINQSLKVNGWETKVFFPRHSSRIYFPLWTKGCRQQSQKLAKQAKFWCLKNNWRPDWIWLQDWEGVYQSEILRFFAKIIWTIHSPVSLAENYGYGETNNDKPIDWSNDFFDFSALIKAGMANADLVTTVSQTYARNLNRLEFFSQKKVIGINNGIDKNEWPIKSGSKWQEFKKINKFLIQQKFGLPIKDIPLFAFVSRLVYQKGIELLIKILPDFLAKNDVQLIVIGAGRDKYQLQLEAIRHIFPDKLGLHLQADFSLPHQVFVGADFLILPSIAEPFGIVVAEARQYGVLPVVRAVDGLADQVRDERDGLSFRQAKAAQLEKKLYQALKIWNSNWFWQTSAKGKNFTKDWDEVALTYGQYLLEADQKGDSPGRRAKKALFFS